MSAETSSVLTAPAAAGSAAARSRPRLLAAGRVVVTGAALGILGQLLFFGAAAGSNVALAALAILVAGWRLRPHGAALRPSDAWLPLAAIVFAGFVALRDDPTLAALDVLAAITLTGASMAALGGFAVVRRPMSAIGGLAVRFAGWVLTAAGAALLDARGSLAVGSAPRPRLRQAGGVLRGLAIALPLVVLFAALFAAADAVFARMLEQTFRIDIDLGEPVARLVLGAVCAWLAAGALAFTAGAGPDREQAPGSSVVRMGTTESLTVLLTVDALFAVFVVLQAAYLFGGLDTLQAAGLSYAEYARRGFFELIAVALLAGCLVLVLEAFVARRGRGYVAAAIGLVLLTGVVLASAVLRLRLYQEAYGWTELRFYALAAIGWLAVGVALAVVALATDRSRWLPHGLVVAAIGIGVAVNVIGPIRFVAEQNVARAISPQLVPEHGSTGLDAGYLHHLGTDAVEPLASALPRLHGAASTEVTYLLQRQHRLLAAGRDDWRSWNLSRSNARELLAGLRLPPLPEE